MGNAWRTISWSAAIRYCFGGAGWRAAIRIAIALVVGIAAGLFSLGTATLDLAMGNPLVALESEAVALALDLTGENES